MAIAKHNKAARLVFAENLKAARLRLGYSQEKLAEISALHRTYVGSVERGERNVAIDNMEKLAKAVQVRLATLLE